MGATSKRILDRLKAAKVSSAWQRRARSLIDEAPDWSKDDAAEIERAVRYVCGVDTPLPMLSARFLERRGSRLVPGLTQARTLDAWDQRALEILLQCSKMYWFWAVERWLDRRVGQFPAEPIFDAGLALFRQFGLWKRDDDAIRALVRRVRTHVDERGALTSAGRWLLLHLDSDPDHVFTIASKVRQGKDVSDERSSLYALLITHRPELFEVLLPTLNLKPDARRSHLAEVMLEAEPKRFEARAIRLVTGLEEGGPALRAARTLHKVFPGKYPAVVKDLVRATLNSKRSSDSHRQALELAWEALGSDATELWKLYKEENDAIRLGFYEMIKKQGGARALPFLIDGLVYPKDPTRVYGHVTYPAYVTRMAALLKGFDLAPWRKRIEKAFARQTNQKIKEEIAGLLGLTKPQTSKARATKAFDPDDGYRFDTYAAALVAAAVRAVKNSKRPLPSPIESIKLTGMQGAIRLETLVIEGVGEPVELELSVRASKVPWHIDEIDDGVLERFAALHGLDPSSEEEVPHWGDQFALPWCALIGEQIAAARTIANHLKKQGSALARGCRIGAGEDDNFWESSSEFAGMTRTGIKALPKARQADFLAVCFEKPERR